MKLTKILSMVTVLVIVIAVLAINFTSMTSIFGAADKNPVILVHGLGGGAYNFVGIQSYLSGQGWSKDRMKALELPSKLGDNTSNGASISSAVDKMISSTGAKKVDIIAHSMGGANSLYYINNLKGSSKVDKLVTLGGANRLVTTKAPSGVAVTTISSSTDMIVNAALLSRLDGANNITINGVTHVGLLFSSNVNSLIKKALGAASSDSVDPSTAPSASPSKSPFSKWW